MHGDRLPGGERARGRRAENVATSVVRPPVALVVGVVTFGVDTPDANAGDAPPNTNPATSKPSAQRIAPTLPALSPESGRSPTFVQAATAARSCAGALSASPVSASKPCRRAGLTPSSTRSPTSTCTRASATTVNDGAVVLGEQDVVVGRGVDRVGQRARAQARRVDADDEVGLGAEPLDHQHAAGDARRRRA